MDFNKILVIAKRNNLPHNDIETIREYPNIESGELLLNNFVVQLKMKK